MAITTARLPKPFFKQTLPREVAPRTDTRRQLQARGTTLASKAPPSRTPKVIHITEVVIWKTITIIITNRASIPRISSTVSSSSKITFKGCSRWQTHSKLNRNNSLVWLRGSAQALCWIWVASIRQVDRGKIANNCWIQVWLRVTISNKLSKLSSRTWKTSKCRICSVWHKPPIKEVPKATLTTRSLRPATRSKRPTSQLTIQCSLKRQMTS